MATTGWFRKSLNDLFYRIETATWCEGNTDAYHSIIAMRENVKHMIWLGNKLRDHEKTLAYKRVALDNITLKIAKMDIW